MSVKSARSCWTSQHDRSASEVFICLGVTVPVPRRTTPRVASQFSVSISTHLPSSGAFSPSVTQLRASGLNHDGEHQRVAAEVAQAGVAQQRREYPGATAIGGRCAGGQAGTSGRSCRC